MDPGCGGHFQVPCASLLPSLEKGRDGPCAPGGSNFGGCRDQRAQRGVRVLPQGPPSC